MKKSVLLFVLSLVTSVTIAQQNSVEMDSTQTQTLNEVLVRSVRVKPNAPITHSNLSKQELDLYYPYSRQTIKVGEHIT